MTNHWVDIKNAESFSSWAATPPRHTHGGFKWVNEPSAQQGANDRSRSALHALGLGGRPYVPIRNPALTETSSAGVGQLLLSEERSSTEYAGGTTPNEFHRARGLPFDRRTYPATTPRTHLRPKSTWRLRDRAGTAT